MLLVNIYYCFITIMGKITRITTRQIHYSIQIGLILLIQVIQVHLCESSILHDNTEKSTNRQFNLEKIFPRERRSSSSNEMYEKEQNKQDVVTKLLSRKLRSSKQVRIDERANYEDDEWKTFSFNNKNSISTKKYSNKFPYNNDADSQQTFDEGRIVFPDEDNSYESYRSNSPTCKGSVICENVPNYPLDIIEKELSGRRNFEYLQSRDEIVEVANRIGSSDDEPLCLSTEEVKYPRVGLTRDGIYQYVVNEDNFVQAVRVEICKNEDSPCRLINEFASGYKTTCEQKYIYRQLLGLHRNGTVGPEYFKIPSSCCCHVKFIGNTWERIGKGIRTNS